MTDSHDGFRDLSAIGDMFKSSIARMKGGFPAWEEFLARGIKFQKHFEQTIVSFNGFTDSLYKISEVAHNTKGGTHEIGTGLINLAMWHRGQEMKLKEMNQALMMKLLGPLQVKVEEWKKTTAVLEREHDKELQKSIRDIKEAAKNAMKTGKTLEAKLKKDKTSDKASTLHQQLEHYHHETDRHLKETEDRERKNLNRVLLEERSWFCGFASAFTRVLDVEAGMLKDLERLQAILKDLSNEVSHPAMLPDTAREMLESWTIPASPATLHKKMTNAPSMISVSSGSSGDSGGPVISGPVISGPIMTGCTLGGGSTVPIQPHPPAPPPTGGAPPPPPPVAPNVPPPPPMPTAHTSVPSVVAPPPHPPSAPRPPPPTTLPPSSRPPPTILPPSSRPPPSHHPQHTSHPHDIPHDIPLQFSQTLPRSFHSYRGASMDGGGMPNNANFIHGLKMNQYNAAPQGGGVPYSANGDHIQNRSLPPVPPGEEPYPRDMYYPENPGVSTSPSMARASFSSNQSADSSRSLSPLETHSIGMPPLPQTHRTTSAAAPEVAQEPENPSSFQEQLMNKVRLRSNSTDTNQCENVYSLPSFNTPPLARASNSMSARPGPPPVSSKPIRPPPSVASKPSRAVPTQTANGHGPPLQAIRGMTQSLDTRHAPPPQFSPKQGLDLEPDEDNIFARALREKRLRSVQTNDRSNPVVGR